MAAVFIYFPLNFLLCKKSYQWYNYLEFPGDINPECLDTTY